jgi:hypothetical protein
MEKPLSGAERRRIEAALLRSWTDGTCLKESFNTKCPSYNQCAQTAIVVRRRYGGEILWTYVWSDQVHFYNCIGGVREDFTKEQFDKIPENKVRLNYRDEPCCEADAFQFTKPAEVDALESAFENALDS